MMNTVRPITSPNNMQPAHHQRIDTRPPLFIDVITTTDDPDAPPVREDRINWNSPRARRWFDSHQTYAMNTGLCVHTRKAVL